MAAITEKTALSLGLALVLVGGAVAVGVAKNTLDDHATRLAKVEAAQVQSEHAQAATEVRWQKVSDDLGATAEALKDIKAELRDLKDSRRRPATARGDDR